MLRNVLRCSRRARSTASAASATPPTIAYGPGRLPLVGHTMSFKPSRMHQFLEECARSEDVWNFRMDMVARQPYVVGDPSLAQAIVTSKAWSYRSA